MLFNRHRTVGDVEDFSRRQCLTEISLAQALVCFRQVLWLLGSSPEPSRPDTLLLRYSTYFPKIITLTVAPLRV